MAKGVEAKFIIPQTLYEEMFLYCKDSKTDMDKFVHDALKEALSKAKEEKAKRRQDGGTEKFDTIFRRAILCNCGGVPQYFINLYENHVRIKCDKCEHAIYEDGTDENSMKKAVEKWNATHD